MMIFPVFFISEARRFPHSFPAPKLLVMTLLITASPADSSRPESHIAILIPAACASFTERTRALSSNGASAIPFMDFASANDTRLGYFGFASSGDSHIYLENEVSGGEIKIQDNTTFAGSIIASGANAKISGSSTSTGSFGHVTVDGVLKTGDIELENERGHWRIIEEEEYLSIYNVKTNKKFKFVLEEIE